MASDRVLSSGSPDGGDGPSLTEVSLECEAAP